MEPSGRLLAPPASPEGSPDAAAAGATTMAPVYTTPGWIAVLTPSTVTSAFTDEAASTSRRVM